MSSEKPSVIDNINSLLGDKPEQFKTIEKEHDGVYMFFSFDLVNSTLFKTRFKAYWRKVISAFYDISYLFMQKRAQERDEPFRVWKYVGDEILLYKKITNRKEIYRNIIDSYYVRQDIYNELCNKFGRDVIKPHINIKACVWIAKCSQSNNDDKNAIYINAIQAEDDVFGAKISSFDFLGPDIDKGFRISKYTEKGKTIVSAKLACLIYRMMNNDKEKIISDIEKKAIDVCFKIVSYKQLKGVWDGRYYPIIWYHHEWKNNKAIFDYDECFTSEIVNKISTNKSAIYNLDILPKVYNDLNKMNEIDEILEYLKNLEGKEKDKTQQNDSEARKKYVNSEVHCVAICFNEQNEIFVVRRSEERKILKGLWECGCGKLNSNETWRDCLIKEYKEDFGLELKLENNPVPIATYIINKDTVIIPGIIFVADVVKKDINLNKQKFSEYKWLRIDEVTEFFKDKGTVENLIDNINRAIKLRGI